MALSWKEKTLLATRGTKFGAVVASALNEKIAAPCFVGKASVTSDGFVMCTFHAKDGDVHMGAFVGSFEDIKHNALGLAEHLALKGEDRKAYATALADWIGQDYSGRAANELKSI